MVVEWESTMPSQPATVRAQAGHIEDAAGAGFELRPPPGVGGAGVDASFVGQRPRNLQPFLAGPLDAVVLLLGEEFRFDAQVATHLVEQDVHQVAPCIWFGAGQWLPKR